MTDSIKHSLFSAIPRLLRPLIRILLRNGVPYGTFADLAKRVYVNLAANECGLPGRKQSISRISILTGLSRKEVSGVLDALNTQIKKSLGRRGPGMFTLPGLVKIEKRKVPARKARKNVPNPFKPGEMMDVAAKPASTKIKVRALKNLKTMA